MLRSTVLAPTLVFCLAGCFNEPPGENASGGSTGAASSTGGGTTRTTDPTMPPGTSTEATGTTGSGGSDSSSGFGTTPGSSTAAEGSSSSTGGPSDLCGCPIRDLVFCEDFEDFTQFDGDKIDNWVVPPPGEPPLQVDGICGSAFRGELEPGEDFAVIVRTVPNILEGMPETDAIHLRGLLRIAPGCADNGPHRLLSARADVSMDNFLYSADIELDGGALVLAQVTPTGPVVRATIGRATIDEWVPFEITLGGLQITEESTVRALVGGTEIQEVRPNFATDPLMFSAVLGPSSFAAPTDAGCTADFDDVSVEVVGSIP